MVAIHYQWSRMSFTGWDDSATQFGVSRLSSHYTWALTKAPPLPTASVATAVQDSLTATSYMYYNESDAPSLHDKISSQPLHKPKPANMHFCHQPSQAMGLISVLSLNKMNR